MKYFNFSILFILVFGCNYEQGISINKIDNIFKDGKSFFMNNNEKYTGRIYNKSANNKLLLDFRTLNGLYDGHYKEFYENGVLKKECFYNNGVMQGVERRFFENGRLLESVNYNSGNFNGVRNVYWENGMLKEVNNFYNGILTGETTYFYSNGKIRKTIKFDSSGRKNGVWKDYNSSGELIKQIIYENGKLK